MVAFKKYSNHALIVERGNLKKLLFLRLVIFIGHGIFTVLQNRDLVATRVENFYTELIHFGISSVWEPVDS